MAGKSIWCDIKNEVEFLNKYPTLLQATSDNESPIPGYLFGEINALTYVNDGMYCKQLVGYFISKTEASSPFVKLKALKMLIYLTKNGHKFVLDEIRLSEFQLKKITGFNTNAQNFQEKFLNEEIRRLSKELLTVVFTEAFEHSRGTLSTGPDRATGYGSQATSNKLSGFGNVSKSPKSMGDRVTEGITSFVDKILSPTNEDDFYKKQAIVLSEALPKYKPVTIDKCGDADIYLGETLTQDVANSPVKSESAAKTKKSAIHIAGRAGGGWDDSEEEEVTGVESDAVISFVDSAELSISVDSIDNKKELPVPLMYAEEHSIVENFAVDEPLEKLKCEDISAVCKRCSGLNCDKILEFIVEALLSSKENVKLRSLVLIEYLLQLDIVNLESLVRIVIPSLRQLADLQKSLVQTKSKKICLIVNCLSKIQNSPKATQSPHIKCKS